MIDMSTLPVIPSPILVLVLILVSIPVLFVLLYQNITSKPARHNTAIILVLGDIGRSPRMMYHAESFARHDWEAIVVGYGDTPPIPPLLELPHVHLLHLANPPWPIILLPWALRAPIRILYQVFSVLYITLIRLPIRCEVLLVQNPPTIPTLALAQLIAYLTGTRLIIDWHNTGYSILAMRTGDKSPLVKVAKWFERRFGRNAWAHLFVTKAMEEFLMNEFALEGKRAVLHDRPPPHFRRTEPILMHELFHRLITDLHPPLPPSFLPPEETSTPLTYVPNHHTFNLPTHHPSRPALVVSSTSWTADEDFSLLLTALDQYQAELNDTPSKLPRLIVVITGKGALRSQFEQAVQEREKTYWTDIIVRCLFVSAKDYPTLLGSADLGVSLHSSSSGRDLPMKVVDMFGCGVPVLARGFMAIGELVKDGKNGRVFETGAELGQQLIDTLTGFPEAEKLRNLQDYFVKQNNIPYSPSRRRGSLYEAEDEWSNWQENWDRVIHRGLLTRTL
ncbi:hypothetical protein BCR39DRAFT_509121 [Naematelia encephala]|uniref:Chitobiosyldiphosphodolichol beta-mannosyltransferase n=1 Tax=Naematelia encephala TaxID=71784 RepID=A0A1Y2BL47_9TREE|nr:hypothetical protein BCR39DRAFT_509121 [Naematelia encephala]